MTSSHYACWGFCVNFSRSPSTAKYIDRLNKNVCFYHVSMLTLLPYRFLASFAYFKMANNEFTTSLNWSQHSKILESTNKHNVMTSLNRLIELASGL